MAVRGIRGATVVEGDDRELILRATRELLETLILANDIAVDDIASIMFTMTPDLQSTYPEELAMPVKDGDELHVAVMLAGG